MARVIDEKGVAKAILVGGTHSNLSAKLSYSMILERNNLREGINVFASNIVSKNSKEYENIISARNDLKIVVARIIPDLVDSYKIIPKKTIMLGVKEFINLPGYKDYTIDKYFFKGNESLIEIVSKEGIKYNSLLNLVKIKDCKVGIPNLTAISDVFYRYVNDAIDRIEETMISGTVKYTKSNYFSWNNIKNDLITG